MVGLELYAIWLFIDDVGLVRIYRIDIDVLYSKEDEFDRIVRSDHLGLLGGGHLKLATLTGQIEETDGLVLAQR